jgi:prolyl-tRNA synthetase
MRWSELSISTLRDEPREGDPQLRLLRRAGYLGSEGPLFLGQRTLDKIARIFETSKNPAEAFEAIGIDATLADPEGDHSPELFHTPNVKTIAELSAFSGVPKTSQIKSVVMRRSDELILVLLRGDHSLDEKKLGDARPASSEEIVAKFGASPGSLGPVGVSGIRILADEALRDRRNMICGANRDDYHLRHVTPGVHFEAEFQQLRVPAESPGDEGVPIVARDRILGHTKDGEVEVAFDRILTLIAGDRRDASGLVLPPMIAPFSVVFTPVNIKDDAQRTTAERLYEEALAAGCDALLDDRDERPGVKFKDAELIGIPWRVTVGKKLAEGKVEILERHGSVQLEATVENAVAFVRSRWDLASAG